MNMFVNELFSLLDQLLDHTMPHLIAVPILVPMLTAALMLLMGEQRRRAKSFLFGTLHQDEQHHQKANNEENPD